MQLDLAARALRAVAGGQPAGLLLRDITVGPPVRFDVPGPRELDVLCAPEPSHSPAGAEWRCELRSPGQAAPHLAAVAGHAAGPPQDETAPGGRADCLRCGPDLVYPPFFHGPAFRVIAAFGRAGSGLGAVLATGLPPLSWGGRPTVLQPRLLELLLQCCGLQELADTGRMMVPAGIDSLYWHPASLTADNTAGAIAMIRPRPDPRASASVFDGQVVTPAGTVLVTVTGYRTTDLGHAASRAHAARLTQCLDRPAAPAAPAPAGPAIPEGASR